MKYYLIAKGRVLWIRRNGSAPAGSFFFCWDGCISNCWFIWLFFRRMGQQQLDQRNKKVPCMHAHTRGRQSTGAGHAQVKMAMGTRNPSTRWVLPDKKTGMEWVFYPWVYYWAKSCSRRVWRVRVRMYTTHTCLPAGKKYPHKKISHVKYLTNFSPYGPWIWPKSN